MFTLWLQIPIYGKFFSLHCQYTLPVIDQNHFEYPQFKIRLWSEISVYFLWKQVPNSAIRDCTNVTDMSGKEFLNPAEDKTVNLNAK